MSTDLPTDPTDLHAAISSLDDARAAQALQLLTFTQPTPGPDPDLAAHLAQAASAGQPTDLTAAEELVTGGDLARAALAHLATDPDRAPDVAKAITLSQTDSERFLDPGTLAVAGLVLIALQTEIRLTTDSEGHWQFTFHKKTPKDSTLGTLAAKMFAAFTPTG